MYVILTDLRTLSSCSKMSLFDEPPEAPLDTQEICDTGLVGRNFLV